LLEFVKKRFFYHLRFIGDNNLYLYLDFCNRIEYVYRIKFLPIYIDRSFFFFMRLNDLDGHIVEIITKWCSEYLVALFDRVNGFCNDRNNVRFLRNSKPFKSRVDSYFDNNDLFRLFIKDLRFRDYFRIYCNV